MAQDPPVKKDLEYILDQVVGVSPKDELTLLRAALRYYAEGHSAQDAVAWAANELSLSLTKNFPR
jgi:hypothetical protein